MPKNIEFIREQHLQKIESLMQDIVDLSKGWYYCGLCKAIGKYNHVARLGLSYDMTFLAVLLSAVIEQDVSQYTWKCVLHPFSKR